MSNTYCFATHIAILKSVIYTRTHIKASSLYAFFDNKNNEKNIIQVFDLLRNYKIITPERNFPLMNPES